MGRPGPATQAKRARERSRQERKQEKQAKKTLRKELKKERAQNTADGIDPDLVGIRPGPQAPIDDLD
ncbi:MAG: hypothetical protein AB7F66_00225 [Bacteriovoracia bacterium]